MPGLWTGSFSHPGPDAGVDDLDIFATHLSQLLHSDDIMVITKIYFCLAMCIQQFPSDPSLDMTALDSIQCQYIAVAETVLNSDEGLARSLDGLECMAIQAHWYVNLGKPRKAWLLFRRAVTTCQVLGLNHRTVDDANLLPVRWKLIWSKLWQGDRLASLLLGLPHAGCSDIYDSGLKKGTQESFWIMLGIIIGHVIERNQNPKSMTLAVTLEIDQELDLLRSSTPVEYSEVSPGSEMSSDKIAEVFLPQLLYHNTRKLLHLPLMLKAATDQRYEYSRIAALEASREMIRIYQIMRNPQRPGYEMCNTVDFHVFTAAMVLIVNLFSHSDRDPWKDDADWNLIHTATQMFRRSAGHGRCNVSAQSAAVLELLSEARAGSAKEVEAVIPYFGKIRISPCKEPSGRDSAANVLPAQASMQGSELALYCNDTTFEFNGDPMLCFRNHGQRMGCLTSDIWDTNGFWEDFGGELLDDWSSLETFDGSSRPCVDTSTTIR